MRRPLPVMFSDAGMTNPSTHCGGRRPKSEGTKSRDVCGGGAAGAYGDFAAGSGLLRLDCNCCRDRLAAERGRIRRCERAIWAWRDGAIVLKNPTTRSGCWNG